MATIITMTGKPRTDAKTGKTKPGTKSYKVRWYYPNPDGKAEEQTVTWRSYADAKLLKGIIEARAGRVRKTDPDVLDHSIVTGAPTRRDTKPFGPTVSEVIDELIAQKTRDGLKQSTIATYECGNRAGVIREFWPDEYVSQLIVPLSDNGDAGDKVRLFLAFLKERGTDHRAPIQFLTNVLTFAVLKGYVSMNPVRLVAMPDVEDFPARFLAQDEFELMLSFVDEDAKPELWLLLVAAWESGLRLGELLGLERNDISIVNDTAKIHVRRTTTEDKRGRISTTLPKNGKARWVSIPVDLAEALLTPGRNERLIFPAPRNPRRHCHKKYVNSQVIRIRNLARAGVERTMPDGTTKLVRLTGEPPRFHDLRHSHISNQLSEGVDLYVVSKRAGHSSIQITADRYGHLCRKDELAQLRAIGAHRVPSKRLGGNKVQLISVAA
jgi:integrase